MDRQTDRWTELRWLRRATAAVAAVVAKNDNHLKQKQQSEHLTHTYYEY